MSLADATATVFYPDVVVNSFACYTTSDDNSLTLHCLLCHTMCHPSHHVLAAPVAARASATPSMQVQSSGLFSRNLYWSIFWAWCWWTHPKRVHLKNDKEVVLLYYLFIQNIEKKWSSYIVVHKSYELSYFLYVTHNKTLKSTALKANVRKSIQFCYTTKQHLN